MRLLFVDFTLPYLLRDSEHPIGGFAVQLKSWTEGLSKSGHRVGVLTWKGAAAYVADSRHCDLLDTYDPRRGARIIKYFYDYIPAMLSAARAFKPDVIVQGCAGVNTGILAFIAGRLHIPFVNRVASDGESDDRIRQLLPLRYQRIAYRYGMRRAAAIICQNTYQLANFERLYPQARLHVIHNPFSLANAQSIPAPRGARAYIAWLAVFRDSKNLPMLFRLAKHLPGIRFRVAGMVEPSTSRTVTETIDALKLLPNVELVGYVLRKDTMSFLSGAVALLSTSDMEGFSNTILEAFSVGTPLVLRRQIDPDMIIAKGRLGFSAQDENELGNRLDEIWNMNPAKFEQMSTNCQRYVREHHDPVEKVNELMPILDALQHRRGRSAAR